MSSDKGKPQPVGVGMTPCKTEFGSFIRARRLELEIRQVPLAQKAGLENNLVSLIEVGVRKYLNNDQLKGLAKVLQIDAEELRKHMPIKPGSQPKTDLGKLIRSRREELGLSLRAFAEKMKTTVQKAKHMEIGKGKTIRYGTLQPLAATLNLEPSSLSEFVGRTRKKTTSELGQLICDRRKELGMSIRMLADKIGTSYQFVSQIELGEIGLSRNNKLLERLAQALELDVARLEALRPKRRRKLKQAQVEHVNPLSGFLAAKRLELHMTQAQMAQRAEVSTTVVFGIERGTYTPGKHVLGKISKALECEIPPELIPVPKVRKVRQGNPQGVSVSSVTVHLYGQNLSDLETIKELSDIRANSEAVRKALKLLRLFLEKQRDGYGVALSKDEDVIKLELLF